MILKAPLNSFSLANILWGCSWLFLHSLVFAEGDLSSESIQYRRVFVPAEDLPMLGSDFVPVNVKEFDRLMESFRGQAEPLLENATPRLTQTLLVASLVGQDLVSNASRMTIACQSEMPRMYSVAPCTLAIRATTADSQRLAESARENFAVDSQPFRYDLNGSISIAVKQPTDVWFGWSLHGKSEQDPSRLTFKFEIPRCIDSRLLLHLPPMWRVESNDSVARPWKDPKALLGSTWPSEFEAELDAEPNKDLDTDKAQLNWWSIELSGSTSVSFDLVQSVDAFQLKYDHSVLRERIEYRLLPSTLEVVSEFQFSDAVDPFPEMTIRVDPGMHIASVTLDEVPLEWRPSRLPFCVDILRAKSLDKPELSSGRSLIVRGLANWPLADGQRKLPTIQIDKACSINGIGSLAIHQDWVVNQLHIENGRMFSRSGTTQLGGLGRCEFEWAGEPPEIVLHVTPRSMQGRAESLTRLANDSDGLVATTWMNIAPSSTPRPALRISLAQGWVIESIQSPDRRFATALHRVPSSDQSEWQIEIDSAVDNQALLLEIRARNTSLVSPDGANSSTLTFEGDRPIAFRDLKQTDVYWIEPTGRYKVEATPELLQCQIDAREIAENQRQRLPSIGEVWLIKPDGGKIPRLTFRRQAAPYTALLETTIEPSILGVTANYRLKCVPLAGAVSSVTIDINHLGEVPIRWRQHRKTPDGIDRWTPVDSVYVRRDDRKTPKNSTGSTTTARIVRISLPNATSEEFELDGMVEFPRAKTDSDDATQIRVPLLSIPEAAQKDAILQIDERLALTISEKNAPWTPLGYVRLETGAEAHRFRYDPIQLASIDIGALPPSILPDVWLSDVVSRYQRYADGQSEFELKASLHANDASTFNIEVPEKWRLRKALLNNRTIDVVAPPDFSSRLQFYIPREALIVPIANLSLIFDGPLAENRHRTQVDFPVIKPTCPIQNQRFELWLPPSLSVYLKPAGSDSAFPPLDFSKFLPSRWYRPLIHPDTSIATDSSLNEIASNANETEQQLSWSTQWSDDLESDRRTLTLLVNESKRAEDWIIVFAGFAISLCLSQIRKKHLATTGFVLMFGILATDGRVLEALQLASLGWVISCVLLVINACYRPKENLGDRSYIVSSRHESRSKVSARVKSPNEVASAIQSRSRYSTIWIGWAIIHIGFVDMATVTAQSQSDRVYHVVLPVDSNDEFSSEVAYVSQDLLQALYQHRKAQDRTSQFLSARYEVRLVESELRNSTGNVLMALQYEVDVRDIRQPIVLPLKADQASFVSLLVDGSEIPLGSRLRWDDHVLQWTPPNRGLTQIELTIAANVNRITEGRPAIEVDVVPCAAAQLNIDSSDMIDVQCNAIGQAVTPGSGQFLFALGPQKSIVVSWRKPELDNRFTMPTATVESEFVVFGDTILARSIVEIKDASSASGYFDLECDSAWQPLGRLWGAAVLLDSVPASSNTRRRYRLKWEDQRDEEQNPRTVVIYWVAGNLRSTLMNLPEIELPGTRIQESLIRFVRQRDSEWTFEGLQSWTTIDTAKRFEWFPRATGEIVSLRKSVNAPSPFLRRATPVGNHPVTLQSQLRFLTNHVGCKTVIAFNDQPNLGQDVLLQLPLGVEVQTVRANQIEVPFSTRTIDDSQIQLQVFLDPDSESIDTITIESIQPYVDFAWTPIPLPKLENYVVDEHEVSAARAVGLLVEWEGITVDSRSVKPNAPTQLLVDPIRPVNTQENLEVDAWNARISMLPPKSPVVRSLLDGSEEQVASVQPQYRIARSRETNLGYVVSQLTRNDERWNFHVQGMVEAGASPIDGVLMEIPLSMLASLQCSHRIASYASADASRQLVYVFSDEPLSKKPFEFKLSSILPPTENNSTTALPEIRMMGDDEWQQWLVVPRSIASQEIRWSLTGARAVEASTIPDFAKANLSDALESILIVIPTTDRPSVRLSNVAANPLPIALSLATHEIKADKESVRSSSSSFFFVPRGQLSIPIRIPSDRKLLAVECNGHPVPESSISSANSSAKSSDEGYSIFNIRLLSSSMPQKITIQVGKFNRSNRTRFELRGLPEIVDAVPSKTLVIMDSHDKVVGSGTVAIDSSRSQAIIVESLLDIVEQASGFIAEASLTERLQWWQDWEEATSKSWHAATHLRDQNFQKSVSDRRRTLMDKLLLSAQINHGAMPLLRDRQQALDLVDAQEHSRSPTPIEHYFLIDSDAHSASRLSIQALAGKPSNWLDSRIWFGWSLWFICAVVAIRCTYRNLDRWIVSVKEFFLNRPWWLLGGLGILSFVFAPSYAYGPGVLVFAFYFAVRTYWNEIRRVETDRRP